ncbi:hypothetical protein [Streptomyces chryseus]|uniref:Uncharacterized protein n=1 Tax=Streptomyces chryseus TaxID=68186 RepID=A0ABQ3DUS5_9ACTN|nr:hypothetical protein [Streptomyces chryseus]GHB10671.1 hypothetical protein GCM10010346_37360 [Streptomyces chryseus]
MIAPAGRSAGLPLEAGAESTPAPAPRSDLPGGDVPGRSPQGVERDYAEGP